jgi:hypothetical protein
MLDSPISVLFNTNSIEIPVNNGYSLGSNNGGFISVGVDGGGVARFISVSSSGVVNVSVSSLPLPTGAATETTLSSLNSKFVLGQGLMSGSIPVVIASNQSSIGITGTVTANIGTTGGLALDATLTDGNARNKVTDGVNNVAVVNSSPSSEYGLVVRNIPSGTQSIQGISNGVAVPVSFSGNDVFGQMVTAGRTPQVAIPFFQSAPSLLMTVTSSGTGVSGSGVGVGQFSTGVGVTSNIKAVSSNIAYKPGSEFYAIGTASFTTPTSINSYQRFGLYNSNDGFSFGYNGTQFGIWLRYNGSDTFIAQGSWNTDTVSGGVSKFTSNGSSVSLVRSNINIYRIRGGWLGISPIYFEILSPDGEFILVHIARFPNSQTSVSLTNPNLCWTIEASKTSSDSTNLVINSGCLVAGIDGDNISGIGSIVVNGGNVNFPLTGHSSLSFTITGIWVGTIAFQYSLDGLNWVGDDVINSTGSSVISTTINDTFRSNVGSYRYYRIISTAWTSGTAVVNYSCGVGTDLNLINDIPVLGTIAINGGIVSTLQLNNISTLNVQITGVWVATLQFEGSVDGVNYSVVVGRAVNNTALVTSTTTNNTWRFSVAGFQYFRVRASAYTSGTATVNIRQSIASSNLMLESLPAGAAVIGSVSGNGNFIVVGPGDNGAAISGNPVRIGASDGTLTRNILSDTTGRIITVGAGASGAAVSGNPILVSGSNGTNAYTLLTDTLGRQVITGSSSSGSALSGNPILIAGSDGTNAQNISVTSAGLINISSLPTGSNTIGTVNLGTVGGIALNSTLTSGSMLSQISNGTNSASVINSNPVGTEFGLVTRNIPSGTQAISGTVTISSGSGLALDSTLTTLSNKVGVGSVVSSSSTSVVLASDVPYLNTRDYQVATFMCVAASVNISQNKSLVSLCNTGLKKVRIVEIYLAQVSSNQMSGIAGLFQIKRCVSHSSGSSITTIESMESSDSLDSGITIRTGATLTGLSSNILRRAVLNTNNYAANSFSNSPNSGVNSLDIYLPIVEKVGFDVKPITIKNNEGITVNFDSSSSTATYDIHILFTQE